MMWTISKSQGSVMNVVPGTSAAPRRKQTSVKLTRKYAGNWATGISDTGDLSTLRTPRTNIVIGFLLPRYAPLSSCDSFGAVRASLHLLLWSPIQLPCRCSFRAHVT